MGPLEQIIGMLPGMGNIKALAENKPDENQMTRVEAIINSMTPDERCKQHIINGSRRKRIARGSGTSVEDVNRLLKQFVQMQKVLKQLGGMAGMAGGGKNARRRAMEMLRNRGFPGLRRQSVTGRLADTTTCKARSETGWVRTPEPYQERVDGCDPFTSGWFEETSVLPRRRD